MNMVRILVSYLAGTLTVTLAVVKSAGFDARMLELGAALSLLLIGVLVMAVGLDRTGRALVALGGLRKGPRFRRQQGHGVSSAGLSKPLTPTTPTFNRVQETVVGALVNMGAQKTEARRAVELASQSGPMAMEALFRRSVNNLR